MSLVLLLISWATFAFGGIYAWGYIPLAVGCAAVGIAGLFLRKPSVRKRTTLVIGFGLLGVLCATLLQLVPLERETIQRLSPQTAKLLSSYDLTFSLSISNPPQAGSPDPVRHSLSVDPRKTYRAVWVFLALSLFVLGLVQRLGERDIRWLAMGLSILGIALSLIGAIQHGVWNGRIYGFWEPFNTSGIAAFGPFINRNHFAGWVLMVMPLSIGYLFGIMGGFSRNEPKTLRERILWWGGSMGNRAFLLIFAIAMMATTLALTRSRSGLVGFAILLISLLVSMVRRGVFVQRPILVAILFLLIPLAAIGWAGPQLIATRFAEAGPTLDGRLNVWKDAWRIHELYPVFGIGINNYGTAMQFHQDFLKEDVHYAQAHNDYLQLLAEGGWLVVIPTAVLISMIAMLIKRRFSEDHDDELAFWIRRGAVAGMLAIAVQEIAEFSLQMPANAALFCVVCAIAIRPSSSKDSSHRER